MLRLMKSVCVVMAMASVTAHASTANTEETAKHKFGERSVFSERATAERTAPSAKVCVSGQGCGAEAATTVAASGPQDPKAVYEGHCSMCHGTGAAGAPKMGDAAAWSARTAKGIDTLLKNALSGVNAMPPKGMCTECSDSDIKATIEYMANNSK
jgi:cytochrome c5